MENTSTLREDLYRRRHPRGEVIPIILQPSMIAGKTPKGEEIVVLVQILQTGRAGGPSGTRTDQLKVYLREATR